MPANDDPKRYSVHQEYTDIVCQEQFNFEKYCRKASSTNTPGEHILLPYPPLHSDSYKFQKGWSTSKRTMEGVIKEENKALSPFYDWLETQSDISEDSIDIPEAQYANCCDRASQFPTVKIDDHQFMCARCYRHLQIFNLEWPLRKEKKAHWRSKSAPSTDASTQNRTSNCESSPILSSFPASPSSPLSPNYLNSSSRSKSRTPKRSPSRTSLTPPFDHQTTKTVSRRRRGNAKDEVSFLSQLTSTTPKVKGKKQSSKRKKEFNCDQLQPLTPSSSILPNGSNMLPSLASVLNTPGNRSAKRISVSYLLNNSKEVKGYSNKRKYSTLFNEEEETSQVMPPAKKISVIKSAMKIESLVEETNIDPIKDMLKSNRSMKRLITNYSNFPFDHRELTLAFPGKKS
ncbi:uncharacterized protein BX663DRAFT_155886 [Cokeromyces recurvatus]|uniref:uncharacterized protein n=1 Tax=Cokeromyces recurvatus TaxID=90255 RepID=UPI00221E7625|nr:uncharacterized protein BX663DRAFT_155886 [Cokeromyces recurvatus]KAI7900413.1 hypothetical protein BX663DRAFT_155886 [Cokeromyces recurvatus]